MKRKQAQVNIRIPRELERELENLAQAENIGKVDVARQILCEGVMRRRQELALRLYNQGKVTRAKAAEIAGISVWEITELLERFGMRWHYSLEEAKEEIKEVIREAQRGQG